MLCLSFNLMYVLVAVSLERYMMAQTNPDKSKLFIHLYVYLVSNYQNCAQLIWILCNSFSCENNEYVSVRTLSNIVFILFMYVSVYSICVHLTCCCVTLLFGEI